MKILVFQFIFWFILPLHIGRLWPNEYLKYLTKTYNFEKIIDYFKHKSPKTEMEYYANVRLNEEHPEGDDNTVFLLLSILNNQTPENYSDEFIKNTLINLQNFSSTIHRISFWKLILATNEKNLFTREDKINLLKKFTFRYDLLSSKIVNEILRLYLDGNEFENLTKFVEQFSTNDRSIIVNEYGEYLYAKAKFKLNKQTGTSFYYNLIVKDDTSSYIKEMIFKDLKTYLGENQLFKIKQEVLVHFSPYFKTTKEKNKLNQQKFWKIKFQNLSSALEGLKYIVKNSRDKTQEFLQINKDLLHSKSENFSKITQILIQENLTQKALNFFNQYKDENNYHLAYSYSQIYKKLNYKIKEFNFIIQALKLNPYNSNLIDDLIDLLRGGNLDKIYWDRAMENVPNLELKGRLVYWYLRYLKSNNKKDELTKWLTKYYSYCPGSYYIPVIQEEFLEFIPTPSSDIWETKDNFYHYLSYTAGRHELAPEVYSKDLEKYYLYGVTSLTNRISLQKENFSTSNPLLSQAKEFLELGEFSDAIKLIKTYNRLNNVTTEQGYINFVLMGESTKDYFLMVHFSKELMKLNKIPTDVLLIPESIRNVLYPKPHRDIVEKYAKLFEVDENVIYAIMRQESYFKENALSSSNAKGLMQIMKPTGEELAKKLSIKSYTLFDPVISIHMGSRFLKYLMNSNENDLRWASIAYNGGPGNLRKWKKQFFDGDFNTFLEKIPWKEPRDYCRYVMLNYHNYVKIDIFNKN